MLATGFDAGRLALPDGALLVVNGSPSTLTGSRIAGYQIRNGDVIQLRVNYYKWIFPV